MGLSRTTAQLLLEESSRRPLAGTVMTLGRLHIYFRWDEFQQFAQRARHTIPPAIVPTLHREPELARQRYISDDSFLTGMGFSQIIRLDHSNYEEVEELFDLNSPELPDHLRNSCDVILDFGTLEHIFHLPHFLRNMHHMLRANGRIIHLTPAANCMDHGFYSLSPTFFSDYYTANHYELLQLRVSRHRQKSAVDTSIELFDYLSRDARGLEIGSLDDRVYSVWAVVQKTADSTCDVVPQQSFYQRRWSEDTTASQADELAHEPAGTKADRLLRLTARWKPVHAVASQLIRTWRKLINSYRKRSTFPLPKCGEYS